MAKKAKPIRTNWRRIALERDAELAEALRRIQRAEAETDKLRRTLDQEQSLRADLAADNNRMRGRDISALYELLILVERNLGGKKVDLAPVAARCRIALGWQPRPK